MKAEDLGKGLQGTLDVLRRLKEHWVLVFALVSALFWARDLTEVYVALPGETARQAAAVSGLEGRIARLEIWLDRIAWTPDPPVGAASGRTSHRHPPTPGNWGETFPQRGVGACRARMVESLPLQQPIGSEGPTCLSSVSLDR
ncbi:MAG: hypothetical protein AAGC57_21920 [Pseudomonadota bacterium]